MTEYEREVGIPLTFDPSVLREIVYAGIEDFEKLGEVDKDKNVFIDNGSDVLFVAHRDYVPRDVFCAHDGNYVFSPQLDDRLGIYVGLHLLPQCGIIPDILLTTDEEIGQSTAQFFHSAKDYNWMFQFDRRGDDVVTYEYDDKVWLKALLSAGFKVGQGTFSDICYLDHLGICGVNVGTAYQDEHSNTCHAVVSTLLDQVDTFHTFWKKYSSTKFPHIAVQKKASISWGNYSEGYGLYRPYNRTPSRRDFYKESRYYDELDCEFCGKVYKGDSDPNFMAIASILEYGCCPTCYDKLSSDPYESERSYCDVCGQFMPDGDYKSGICFYCYSQMVK